MYKMKTDIFPLDELDIHNFLYICFMDSDDSGINLLRRPHHIIKLLSFQRKDVQVLDCQFNAPACSGTEANIAESNTIEMNWFFSMKDSASG